MFAGSRLLLPVLRTVLHWCRNPGGRRDMLSEEALAAEGDRGAEEVGQHGEAETARTASGCPRRWCWSDRRSGGTEGSLPGSRGGGCRPRGSGEVGAVRQEAGACCRPPCWGRSRERGLAAGCPQTGGAIAVRQEAERRAVHQRMSSTIAWHHEWEPRSWLRTERPCVGEPDREFYFFSFPLSPLSSLSLLILSPFLSPRLSLPPGTPRPPWSARGGVERSLGSTPRPARGDGGMWRVGRGREPWERSEAGGVNDDERHLHHSPVSSPHRGAPEG